MAHSDSINCLSIGKRARRLFVTGGDDHIVNLWTIGKATALMVLPFIFGNLIFDVAVSITIWKVSNCFRIVELSLILKIKYITCYNSVITQRVIY